MVSKNLKFAASVALAALMQASCVMSNQPENCTFDGAKYLPSGIAAAQVCETFQARLSETLRAGGSQSQMRDLAVKIELGPRGALNARVSKPGDADIANLPDVGVDVMDRAVKQRDFDSLADAVAQLLMTK